MAGAPPAEAVLNFEETGALSGADTEQIRTALQAYKEQVNATWKA